MRERARVRERETEKERERESNNLSSLSLNWEVMQIEPHAGDFSSAGPMGQKNRSLGEFVNSLHQKLHLGAYMLITQVGR